MRTLLPLLPTQFWAWPICFVPTTALAKSTSGIGVYKDETGKTPVLTSVKKAEQYLLENETTKNYLGIDGIPEFGRCTQELLFGKGSTIVSENEPARRRPQAVPAHCAWRQISGEKHLCEACLGKQSKLAEPQERV